MSGGSLYFLPPPVVVKAMAMSVMMTCLGGTAEGNGQMMTISSTPCTATILNGITPCFSFIVGSAASNGSLSSTRRHKECCNALKSMVTEALECACLIATGNVPFSIPSVRIPLQQCNAGVPLQCKGSGVPLPAPAQLAQGKDVKPIVPRAKSV
ncbi:hypothetical protein DM860_015546 [Cuscuta australis]|uniref:Bifunctional inhibitor/plant lipid transfer protein/seed storage helical domain-containing protein n=1 Tax=Cuscuta australis TaxID=267555 RepID=A0A328DIU0_9ASTE|nr:hypothetical protein DM860_015546 [Cuscuta australis]